MERCFRIMEIIKNMKSERIKSIDKALDLLEFLSGNGNEIGIAEISKRLEMGLSTVHRILNTLKSRGYVIQNQKNTKYRLGIKLFELGCEVQNTKSLIKIIRPYLRKLSKMINETINLAILEGKEVIYLDTIESSEILRTGIHQGTRLPAHCTALGKALLAFLPEQDFNDLYKNNETLVSITPNSISSFDELKKELKKVKEQGYAMDREEFKAGINCISYPIFNANKEAIAAISLTGPATRLTLDKMENDKHILINISKQISENILM
jgi:IclR family transcriptional regulator, KDG regulon repressor